MRPPDPIALIRGLCEGLMREDTLQVDYVRWFEEQVLGDQGADGPTPPGPAQPPPSPADAMEELAAIRAVLDQFDPSSRKPEESTSDRLLRVLTIYRNNNRKRR